MTRLQRLTGLIVCGYLSWAGSARADAVTDWNAIAVQTILAAVPPVRAQLPYSTWPWSIPPCTMPSRR